MKRQTQTHTSAKEDKAKRTEKKIDTKQERIYKKRAKNYKMLHEMNAFASFLKDLQRVW